MARSEKKIETSKALTVATHTIHVIDITNYSGCSTTIKCPSSAAGSMFYEWCNINSSDDTDWNAVPTAQYPNATVTLAASTSKTINVHGLHVGFLRVRVTLSAGSGNYDFYSLAKDF